MNQHGLIQPRSPLSRRRSPRLLIYGIWFTASQQAISITHRTHGCHVILKSNSEVEACAVRFSSSTRTNKVTCRSLITVKSGHSQLRSPQLLAAVFKYPAARVNEKTSSITVGADLNGNCNNPGRTIADADVASGSSPRASVQNCEDIHRPVGRVAVCRRPAE